jgi:hypothetical protein
MLVQHEYFDRTGISLGTILSRENARCQANAYPLFTVYQADRKIDSAEVQENPPQPPLAVAD